MKKICFLNILYISLLFFIIFLFLANSINAQTYFNPSIGYGYPGYGVSTYSGSGGYAGYGYPGSFYGGYSGYSYPGYVSWSGPFAYSQDSKQWVPLNQYSSGPGPGIPNLANPIYGLVPPGYSQLWAATHYSVPSWIMEMMLTSKYSPSDPDIAQIGYQLSLPYFYADVMRGWTPWVSPYSNPQTYYKYGGYPPISPISGAPPGMAYDPYNRSFYIPGQYRVGYPWTYYR